MKIAIQASDLDHARIDGTRVYIHNLLKEFGKLDSESEFLIYHKNHFNPELAPPDFRNYQVICKSAPFMWTQTRFAWELWKSHPNVLWMPMQALPLMRRKSLKAVVTIHDLAFKYFPDHFPTRDLRRLNWLTSLAIRKSSHIIAVSNSTKKDILKFYPEIQPEKIRVIHHGFDSSLFSRRIPSKELEDFLSKNYPPRVDKRSPRVEAGKLKTKNYLLYVGAIQPRKNLGVIIDAFSEIKKDFPKLKLVLVGEKAWKWESTLEKIESCPYKEDIIMPGKVKFGDLPALYQGASAFVFPSLYEGFGLPILEAFASRTPVVTARNSSLEEIGAEAALYFQSDDTSELASQIKKLLSNEQLRQELIDKGNKRVKNFSWEKCAQKTLDYLKY